MSSSPRFLLLDGMTLFVAHAEIFSISSAIKQKIKVCCNITANMDNKLVLASISSVRYAKFILIQFFMDINI